MGFVAELGGEQSAVVASKLRMPSERDDLIVALYRQGVPVIEIADDAGVCVKTVRNVAQHAAVRKAARQGDLGIQSMLREGGGCSPSPPWGKPGLNAAQASASGANSWEDGVAALVRSRMAGNVVFGKETYLMAATNLNRVCLTGNLTRDPELRNLPSGMSVCSLRVASNTRRKDQSTGEWVDKPNYFDVTVWGAQGENCAQYLSKGRPVAIDGRLEWREWQDKETGKNRQSIDIIADSVQFLGSREGGENGGRFTPQSDVPADTADFAQAPVAAGGSDDDIPF
jgi:single-strand DNA-binding protein